MLSFALRFLVMYILAGVIASPAKISVELDKSYYLSLRKFNRINVTVENCVTQEIEVQLEVDGGQTEIYNTCGEVVGNTNTQTVKCSGNITTLIPFHIKPLVDGEYKISVEVNAGKDVARTVKQMKTIGKTESREKTFDLFPRLRNYESFYDDREVEGMQVIKSELKVTVGATEINKKNVHEVRRAEELYRNLNIGDMKLDNAAFNAKFLICAKHFMEVDRQIIDSGLESLAAKQEEEGKFSDGDTKMVDEQVAMTAFVSSLFYENPSFVNKYRKTVDRAVNYVIQNIENVTDPYALAVSAYALSIEREELAANVYERLKSLSVESGIKEEPRMSWKYSNNSMEIQTAAYAILASSNLGRNEDTFRIMRWFWRETINLVDFTPTIEYFLANQVMTECSQLMLLVLKVNDTIIFRRILHKPTQPFNITVPGDEEIAFQTEGRGSTTVEIVHFFRMSGLNDVEDEGNICVEEKSRKLTFPVLLAVGVLCFTAAVLLTCWLRKQNNAPPSQELENQTCQINLTTPI
jgi:hypothetical protein